MHHARHACRTARAGAHLRTSKTAAIKSRSSRSGSSSCAAKALFVSSASKKQLRVASNASRTWCAPAYSASSSAPAPSVFLRKGSTLITSLNRTWKSGEKEGGDRERLQRAVHPNGKRVHAHAAHVQQSARHARGRGARARARVAGPLAPSCPRRRTAATARRRAAAQRRTAQQLRARRAPWHPQWRPRLWRRRRSRDQAASDPGAALACRRARRRRGRAAQTAWRR